MKKYYFWKKGANLNLKFGLAQESMLICPSFFIQSQRQFEA